MDLLYQIIFKLAYQLHLIICFLFRPTVQGVYVAVWYDNQILLIKNSYKKFYTIPCGGINKNESITQAGIRELYEEVGIKAEEDNLINLQKFINYEEYKEDHIHLYELFLTEKPLVKVDNREVIWAEFNNINDALNFNLFKPVRSYLESKK